MVADELERGTARRTEPFEARELGLDRDDRGADGVHHGATVRDDGGGGAVENRGDLRRRGVPGPGPQARGIGVEAEDDLALPRRDPLGEAVAERRRRRRDGGRDVAGRAGH